MLGSVEVVVRGAVHQLLVRSMRDDADMPNYLDFLGAGLQPARRLPLCRGRIRSAPAGLDGCKPRRSTCPGWRGQRAAAAGSPVGNSCACSWPEAGVVVCRSQVKRPRLMATAGHGRDIGAMRSAADSPLGSVPVLTCRPVRTA